MLLLCSLSLSLLLSCRRLLILINAEYIYTINIHSFSFSFPFLFFSFIFFSFLFTYTSTYTCIYVHRHTHCHSNSLHSPVCSTTGSSSSLISSRTIEQYPSNLSRGERERESVHERGSFVLFHSTHTHSKPTNVYTNISNRSTHRNARALACLQIEPSHSQEFGYALLLLLLLLLDARKTSSNIETPRGDTARICIHSSHVVVAFALLCVICR